MTGWPEGYDSRIYTVLDSTLTEAGRLLPDLTMPTWILAEEQTAARGRRGRAWATPRGNFAATLVMRRNEPPGTAALRSFVTSLALYRAFATVLESDEMLALKWPNDVLLGGAKVAGILLESLGEHLVIGIGVNLLHPPEAAMLEPGALPPATLAEHAGRRVSASAFLDILAPAYATLERQFREQGFAPIRSAWLSHAARIGETVTARTMREETTGVFEDVDLDGNLILRTSSGRVKITAADVFF